jgi:hypothetical protein
MEGDGTVVISTWKFAPSMAYVAAAELLFAT